MKSEKRRNSIIDLLKNSNSPINATTLANTFNVTRQIIVADIALLRASGHAISSNNRGYTLNTINKDLIKKIAVQHGKDDVINEFYAVVDNGGKVIDVIIEHPIYSQIAVELNITSRYDADEFAEKLNNSNCNPLSLLTQGIHIHTIEVPNEQSYLRIINKLSSLKILVE